MGLCDHNAAAAAAQNNWLKSNDVIMRAMVKFGCQCEQNRISFSAAPMQYGIEWVIKNAHKCTKWHHARDIVRSKRKN